MAQPGNLPHSLNGLNKVSRRARLSHEWSFSHTNWVGDEVLRPIESGFAKTSLHNMISNHSCSINSWLWPMETFHVSNVRSDHDSQCGGFQLPDGKQEIGWTSPPQIPRIGEFPGTSRSPISAMDVELDVEYLAIYIITTLLCTGVAALCYLCFKR